MSERSIHTDDGRDLLCEIRLTRLPYREQQLVRGSYIDITGRKFAESEIKRLAFSDPLTDLPNRRLLLDRMQQAITVSVRHQRRGALLMVDLDDFKSVNDSLGHDKGDLLLQQVGKVHIPRDRGHDSTLMAGSIPL
jgi:PleD family two-component response regulator